TERQFRVSDLWELKNGDFVTITNRIEDVPPWFELHPLEAAGRLAYWMMEKLNSGYKPSEPCDGPNLWRIFAGDRLLWIGPSRSTQVAVDGVLGLIEFES